MADEKIPAGATLASMLIQGQQAQALIVAAQLGIPDLLAEGPQHAKELALTTRTHPRALYRLLRALASYGVLCIQDDHRFALTPLAEPLRTDVPGSLRALSQYFAVENQAWSGLFHSVQTGASAWEHQLGTGHYAYFAQNPEANAHFNAAMTGITARGLPDILTAHDFGGLNTIVDVGGGRGTFLAGILQAYPSVHGILLDLPHVVAEAPPVLEAAGIADRSIRWPPMLSMIRPTPRRSQEGKYKGRQPTARAKAAEVIKFDAEGFERAEIARRTGIGVASVYRVLADAKKLDAGRTIPA